MKEENEKIITKKLGIMSNKTKISNLSKITQKNKKKIKNKKKNIQTNSSLEIYMPHEDSYLLSKYVSLLVKENDTVLDMGCGSGIQTETALKKTKNVIGVDINPNAVTYCQNSEYTKGASFFKSNLFEIFENKNKYVKYANKKINVAKNFPNKFDVIIFNPPYLPDNNDPKEIKDYTTGGKKGYEIIERFFSNAARYLSDKGFILIVFSSLTNKLRVDSIIEKYLFEYELLEEKNLFFEKLYCYKISKSVLLKKLNALDVFNVSYFSRGRRGYIYSAVYKNKRCIIKSKNPKSKAVYSIRDEAKWLTKLNKYNIAPRLYLFNEDFIIMEYIDGDFILDFFEKNKHDKIAIKSLILDLIDQLYLLDKLKIEKSEMSHPIKHIIIKKKRQTFKAVLIDFERARYVQYPGNVTQFLHFVSSSLINGKFLSLDKNKIIELSKEYVNTYNIRNIKDYIKKI